MSIIDFEQTTCDSYALQMDVGPYETDLVFTQKTSENCLSMIVCSPYSTVGAVELKLNQIDALPGDDRDECSIEKKYELNTDLLKRNVFGSLVIMIDLSYCTAKPVSCGEQSLEVNVRRAKVASSISIETKTVIFVMVGVIAGGLGNVLFYRHSQKSLNIYNLKNSIPVTVIYIISLTNVDTLAKLESSRDSRERVSQLLSQQLLKSN